MLFGRDVERATLASLLTRAKSGHGGAVVVRGEPGIGKTALLEDLKRRADGMTVLVASGIETESALAYAALSELLAPVLDVRLSLPGRRRAALEGALGLGEGPVGDRFGCCAATLSLLAEVADRRPVLAVVDDAHWLDDESAEALRFSARRLAHDRACLVFAVREREGARFEATGLAELRLAGLDREAASALLRAQGTDVIEPHVAERLDRATRGNPLALLELARLLSPAQLAGIEALPDPLPAGPNVERAFGRRIATLPEGARRALMIAAADDSGRVEPLARALRRSGLDLNELADAEAAGLIAIEAGRVEFSHPLLRTAAYRLAPMPERRAAHAALATALEGSAADRGLRAWHLAAATIEPDEMVAAELEAVAGDAQRRAAPAVAGRAMEAAARVTATGERRAQRLLAAGQAHHLAGAPERALELLDAALAASEDPRLRADVQRARAQVQGMRGPPAATRALLVAEAALVEPHDAARAAAMRLEAALSSTMAGEPRVALRLAEQAWPLADEAGGPVRLMAALVLGVARIMRGDAVAGEQLLREARPLQQSSELSLFGNPMALAGLAELWLERYQEGRGLLGDLVDRIREEGALTALPYALMGQAFAEYFVGDWCAAYVAGEEAMRLAGEIDQPAVSSLPPVALALVAGGQGRLAEARGSLARALELSRELGIGSMETVGGWARGIVEMGAGEYEDAIAVLEPAGRYTLEQGLDEPGIGRWAQELAEAYIRVGRVRDAEATLAMLERQADATGRPLAHASSARCRGLLAGEDEFAAHFERALAAHAMVACPLERARTDLCFGERLRRSGQRILARERLEQALVAFDALGAEPWGEHARRELAATGQRARRRTDDTADELTAQELQVALLVAAGATNKEAATALFVSPKTIETHLLRVYRKLGVHSRVRMARRLQSDDRFRSLA